MLVNPGYESFKVKEARVPQEDYPDWGDVAQRGIYWETATAVSLLVAGAELLILYHPQSVETLKGKIKEIFAAEGEE
jgi:CO dehydrogenase/acetyl-CoA synthase delta subunit